MKITTVLTDIRIHKLGFTKILLSVIAIVFVILGVYVFTNSQTANSQRARQSQQAVANHTETLNEIQQAVIQLKNSNAADHAQTVKYINCVLVGVTDSTSQSQALAVYQQCLVASGA